MDVNLHHAGIELGARGFITLNEARGTRLLCLDGELWITQDRDPNDYFIAAGETFEITVHRAVIVQAQRAARVLLLDPLPSRERAKRAWFRAPRLDAGMPVVARLHGA